MGIPLCLFMPIILTLSSSCSIASVFNGHSKYIFWFIHTVFLSIIYECMLFVDLELIKKCLCTPLCTVVFSLELISNLHKNHLVVLILLDVLGGCAPFSTVLVFYLEITAEKKSWFKTIIHQNNNKFHKFLLF